MKTVQQRCDEFEARLARIETALTEVGTRSGDGTLRERIVKLVGPGPTRSAIKRAVNGTKTLKVYALWLVTSSFHGEYVMALVQIGKLNRVVHLCSKMKWDLGDRDSLRRGWIMAAARTSSPGLVHRVWQKGKTMTGLGETAADLVTRTKECKCGETFKLPLVVAEKLKKGTQS